MKKLMSKLMVGAVALSVLAPSASFAATNAASTVAKDAQYQGFNRGMKQMTLEQRQENQDQLMELIKKYTPELAAQFQAIFNSRKETMKKINEIREQVKAGTLTEEDAQAQLKELGVNFGGHRFGGKQLDEETKVKVDAIREQVKAGTLTEEDAQAQLKELGVNFGGHRFGGKQLDEETKAKVDAIREQVKAGTLTEEDAQAQLKELGVNFGGHSQSNLNNQLKEAVDANDEAKVKELLTQFLTHLQGHEQK